MTIYEHDSDSGIFDQPLLSYGAISGLTVSGSSGAIQIPLVLTSYKGPRRTPKIGTVTTIPVMNENYSFGGNTQAEGASELPKIQIEGQFDTPGVISSGLYLYDIVIGGTTRISYGELIAMCFEGRAFTDFGFWLPTNPTSFRDPYGRVYNNPRVSAFTATYTEGAPMRQTFSMTMYT